MKFYLFISSLAITFLANGQESQLIGILRTVPSNLSLRPPTNTDSKLQVASFNTVDSKFSNINPELPYQLISVNGGYAYDEHNDKYYCILTTF